MRILPAFLVLAAMLVPGSALASACYSFVERDTRYAALGPVAIAAPVEISYVVHSTYRIESAAGVTINTDYFGANGPGGLPQVVTMNRAHESHFTNFPNPEIAHVLRGWDPTGEGKAEHQLEVDDVVIRNVTTDIRGWGETGRDGNSIFVFEIGGLCIGHLGHLHHTPTDEQFALLGRIDVLMVPVDGSFTMAVPEMIEVAKTLKSRVVLPMHYFGRSTLERFLQGMSDEFAIDVREDPVLTVSIETLPPQPTVIVLPPARNPFNFD